MRQVIEALSQLARIAAEAPAAKETLSQAASIIRQATRAAEAMVVYAGEDDKFLTCSHDSDDACIELSLGALTWVQRHATQAGEPVAFNLVGRRVEDFTSALNGDGRQFLAFIVPTSEGAAEMCILRGTWQRKDRARILRFMESATPALSVLLDRLVNADRGQRLGQQLHTLANAAQVLTRSEDVETALTDLATAIGVSTGYEIVNIDLYDTATGRFFLRIMSRHRFSSGTLGQIWKASLNPNQPDPWNVQVMRSRQPRLAPDMQNDPLYPEHVRKFYVRALLKSAVDFPLLFQDEFLGTMSFVSFKPHNFPPEQVSLLQGYVAQVATALKALQMHREVQRYAQELKRSADQYIATTNLTGDIIARLDKHGDWTFLNDAACQFYGKPRKQLLGTDSTAFLHPEDVEFTAQAIRQMRADKKPVGDFVNRQVTPMGTRVVEWNGYPLFDDEGQYTGIQITGRDVTERKQMEEALRESEARYRMLAENASDLIWTMDMNLRYTYMSPSVERMRGYTTEEIIGTRANEAMTPASLEAIRKAFVEEMARGKALQDDLFRSRTLEAEMYCMDGSTIWTEVKLNFLRDPDGRPVGIMGVTRDISERKQMEEERARLHAELEVRAVTDGLTGLYNHAHFYERLAEETDRSRRYGQRLALVMMDVDAFKHYNDSRGHQAGDTALHLIAGCIRTGLRRSDIAFRYGGDEFAAILPHADAPRAQTAVSRINRRIAARLREMNDPAAGWLGLSAGVACFPDDAATAEDLVRTADAALYNAKRVAWARGVKVQGQAVEPPPSPPEPVHETQTGTLSAAAGSLAAVLRDLGVSEIVSELDLRAIATVGTAAEIKDRYMRGHQERTSLWAATLAEEMKLSPEQVRNIRIASLLHDIGKVTVNDNILNKPGKLTEEEFAKVKQHAPLGAKIMTAEAEALQQLATIVRHHHEHFDGGGYPDGLTQEDIPLEARILAVVDVFDAMTHDRAYRKALSREEAIAELKRGAGTQFDPAVVQAFVALAEKPGEKLPAPAQAASEDSQPVAVRATGGSKG